MNNIKKGLLVCLFVCAHVQAASFDCGQARSAQEKLVCSNDELSALDTQLGEAYGKAKKASSGDETKRLETEQRRWLRTVRDSCTDKACLTKAYTIRLNQLDPLADKQLTCTEMRQFPKRVFSDDIDLGSGTNSPNEVDYQCPESLSQQKFMQPLLALAERIRGDQGPQPCTGTMVHAQWRGYQFTLTAAGFFPYFSTRKAKPISAEDVNWNTFARANESGEGEPMVRYFKQWSEHSLHNHSLYGDFTAEVDRVLPVLVRHYEAKLGLATSNAQSAALNAISHILYRAAGSSPRADLKPDSGLVRLVRKSGSTAEDTRHALGGSKNKPSSYSEEDIGQALRVALIHNRPLPIVSALADMLDTKALGRKKTSDEPLLSLAIGNQQNLAYLLRRNVPVNAANDFGKTALFYAIGTGNHQAVDTLLKAGANANQTYTSARELKPDEYECVYYDLKHTRRTPLMHAAQHSDVVMLKALVRAHAHLDVADDIGYNAFDYAVLGKLTDNQAYLKSLGLKPSPSKKIPD